LKKIFSISLIILTIAAMLQLSVSTHWCRGNIAGTKVSLIGKTAGCGMEDSNESIPVSGLAYSSHCCKTVVSFYGITGNYFPSFQFVPGTFHQLTQNFNIPDRIAVSYPSSLKVYLDKSPPHDYSCHNVDLTEICTLRI
jgi:hypothetical protein